MISGSAQALTAMFAAAAGIETYRELKAGHFPPRPVRFTGLAVVYAALALLGHLSPGLAGVLGFGMLAALIIKVPGGSSKTAAPKGPVAV